MADILSVCASEGLKKTHVMYRANLSYDQINFYLTELLSSQLIAHLNSDHSSVLYRTSGKRVFKFISTFGAFDTRCPEA